MLRNKKLNFPSQAFLLIELLIGAMVISTVGIAVSQTFSSEIRLVAVATDYKNATRWGTQKLLTLELEMKQTTQLEELEPLLEQSGTFKENSHLKWTLSALPYDEGKYPRLLLLQLLVSGLRKERELSLTKIIRLSFLEGSEDEDEEEKNVHEEANEENEDDEDKNF